MNCADTRENMVAWMEGLLLPDQTAQFQAHLHQCEACRLELASLSCLQQRLTAAGEATPRVAIANAVMNRVRAEQKTDSETLMSKILKHRWGFGLGAAAAATAAAIFLFLVVPATDVHAAAARIMTRGAQAVSSLTSIHLRGNLRTLPNDNFGYIDPHSDFCTIELWKQFQPQLKWRVEKPGRVVFMNGTSTVQYIRAVNTAYKLPQATPGGAFDTEWLDRIANLSVTLTNELKNALAKGWKMSVAEQNSPDGRLKSVVTINATSGLPQDDYLHNKFFDNADTRRVYSFDSQNELLEAVQIYLTTPTNQTLIFELTQIEYNQPLAPPVFDVALPPDVGWYRDLEKLPDNEKYAAMTPVQAARAFFEACSRRDWTEAQKFERSPINDHAKDHIGGLQLIKLGEPFTSKAADPSTRFVPYEIKVTSQACLLVTKTNSAGRYVITGMLDSGLKPVQDLSWTSEPAKLPSTDACTTMAPADIVKTYFSAMANQDWTLMGKIASPSDVERTKSQAAQVTNASMNWRELNGTAETGEATWSNAHSGYLVKCSLTSTRKWNLALRKDQKTGRWYIDGGF